MKAKALVGTFNQEKVIVGAFSMIVKYSRRFVWSSSTDGTCHRTRWTCAPQKVSCFQQPPAAAGSTKPWKHRKWVRLNSSGLCSGPAAAAFISSIEWNCMYNYPPPPLLLSPLTVSSGLVMLISPNRNSIEEIEADIINIFVALHSLLRNNIRQMLAGYDERCTVCRYYI